MTDRPTAAPAGAPSRARAFGDPAMSALSEYGRLLADAAPILPGLLGRLLFHFDQARRGRRPAVGWLLACELGIAVPMGFIGKGAAAWAGLTGDPAFAAAIVVSFMGPRVLELLFDRWQAKAAGGKP